MLPATSNSTLSAMTSRFVRFCWGKVKVPTALHMAKTAVASATGLAVGLGRAEALVAEGMVVERASITGFGRAWANA
jgi:hypothetical protein